MNSESTLTTPRKGIHAHRIPFLDLATIDTLGTIGGAYLIAKYMDWSFLKTTLGLFALSIPIHHYFRVHSTLHDATMKVLDIEMTEEDIVEFDANTL